MLLSPLEDPNTKVTSNISSVKVTIYYSCPFQALLNGFTWSESLAHLDVMVDVHKCNISDPEFRLKRFVLCNNESAI